MKCLFRFRTVYSNADLLPNHVTNLQFLCHSITTRPSGNPNRKNTEEAHMKNGKEKKDFADLFNEITEILGTHEFNVDNSTGVNQFPIMNKGGVEVRGLLECTEGVCENAYMNQELEMRMRTAHIAERDVSPIVHKATQILRGW
ncbi:hypothetical protein HanRHA438_Chr14g0668501 [Helianthus annuus]|nr:hypothetical protein HanRHA438_Chr14g0668501 [Helianthus annuus]